MKKDLLVVKNDKVLVGTWDLSEGFKITHAQIKRLIEKYRSDFDDFGEIINRTFQLSKLESQSKKIGRPIEEFQINKEHYIFLISLLRNSDKSIPFKKKLTSEFSRMEKFISRLNLQKQNEEWLANREHGKIARRDETDAIKQFIKLAEIQGSANGRNYYMIITKMQYECMFSKDLKEWNGGKWKGIRDKINVSTLNACMVSDKLVEIAVKKAVQEKLEYHEAFQYLKKFNEHFFMSVPKIGKEEATGQKDCHFNKTLLI